MQTCDLGRNNSAFIENIFLKSLKRVLLVGMEDGTSTFELCPGHGAIESLADKPKFCCTRISSIQAVWWKPEVIPIIRLASTADEIELVKFRVRFPVMSVCYFLAVGDGLRNVRKDLSG